MAEQRPTTVRLDPVGRIGSEPVYGAYHGTLAVERARQGDLDAFQVLVETHLASAFRTAFAILGSEADARDACQDAFVHAWRELPRLRDPDRFEAWLGRILVNACRSALRSRGRRSIREIPFDAAATASLPARAPAFDDRVGDRDVLERAFERLPIADRTILVLHHLEHRPLAEIAVVLGVPVGTVKSRLHAARHAFERALEVTTK